MTKLDAAREAVLRTTGVAPFSANELRTILSAVDPSDNRSRLMATVAALVIALDLVDELQAQIEHDAYDRAEASYDTP